MNAPDMTPIVQEVLHIPYDEMDCWALLRRFYREGLDVSIPISFMTFSAYVQVVWQDDEQSADPLACVRPWDALLFRVCGPQVHHIGIVYDIVRFIHTSPAQGVTLQPCQRWKPYIFQIARPRRLM